MTRHFKASKCVHRFTVNAYPDGGMTLAVQTRDLATLPAVARAVFLRLQVIEREGVYLLGASGQWDFDRELGSARTVKPGIHGESYQDAGKIVLAAMPGFGTIRPCDLRELCPALTSSTFKRTLRRLVNLGTLRRDKVKGRRETFYSLQVNPAVK